MLYFITFMATIITIIEIFGIYNLKKFNLSNNLIFYIIGGLSYALIAFIFSKLMSSEKIGIINHTWNIMSSILAFIMAYVLFNEKLNKYEMIGVLISLVGLVLMSIKNN